MIVLDTTLRTLEIHLGGAITTNQLPWVATYKDKQVGGLAPEPRPFTAAGQTNSGTAVTMVTAPTTGVYRQIPYLNVYNADTVAATTTVRYNDNSTTRILIRVALAVGDSLVYTEDSGWFVINSSGQIKYTAAAVSVAADAIWDAKGDLAVGTGADTAAKLTIGTNGAIAVANSGTASGISWNLPATATVATSETTTSVTLTDLATPGPAVTVTVGASGTALVIVSTQMSNNTANTASYMGFAISGATTRAASVVTSVLFNHATVGSSDKASYITLETGLTAGSNTFTAKYAVGGGTGTFLRRDITVIPF